MHEYTPILVGSNFLIFVLWCIMYNCTLTRRFSLRATVILQLLSFPFYLSIAAMAPYNSILRLFLTLVFILLPMLLLFRDRWYRIAFVFAISMVIMIVSDLVPCILLLTPEMLRQGITFQPIPVQLTSYSMCIVLNALLLWIAALAINRYKNGLGSRELLLFILFPASQMILLYRWSAFWQNDLTTAAMVYLLACLLICSAADVALFFAIRGLAQRSRLQAENALLSRQIDLQKEHYAAITAQYEAIRHMRHDIASHLYTMRVLLEEEQYGRAREYAAEVEADCQYQSHLGECENPVLDAYLFARLGELQKQGLEVEARVAVPYETGIANADLISAFGNLLDNAAEACADLSDKHISLSATTEKGYLTIETKNAAPTAQKAEKRRVPQLERGIGFHILRDLAARYQGSFSYGSRDGCFTTSLILKGGTPNAVHRSL